MKTSMTRQRLSCSPLGTDNTFMEEANSKVRRYSPEERKERIHRYRTKRALRNFNKTIKVYFNLFSQFIRINNNVSIIVSRIKQ